MAKRAAPPAGKPPRATKSQATSPAEATASQRIDQRIAELDDWRGATLAKAREVILAAAPGIIETWKWRGTPVWELDGILCTGETYQKVVKLTFAHGAALPDPAGLFNSSLEGNTRRAIDFQEGDKIPVRSLTALVRAAIAHNQTKTLKKQNPKAPTKSKADMAPPTASSGSVKLLSGGNPQIAKADGDAPVQAYIAAMPGWKSDLGRRIDQLVVRAAPQVRKAVKWNSPFYGMEGQGWFLSFHTFTRYVKVTFFEGLSLRPIPPGGTEKSGKGRWIDIFENDKLDEAQMTAWIKQAAAIPGWKP